VDQTQGAGHWAKHAAHAGIRFVAKHKVYFIAAGIGVTLAVAPELAPEEVAAVLSRAAVRAAGPIAAAKRIDDAIPAGASTKQRLAIVFGELVRPGLTKAGKVGALAFVIWRSVRNFGH
jgi:hypothetical protein